MSDEIESPPASIAPWIGRIAAPLFALLVWFLAPSDLKPAARSTAAIGTLMAVLWITEGLPLAATSLLPLLLFPVAGVASFKEAAAPYADGFIFLYLGGFLLALTISRWGLDRRLALLAVLTVGVSPRRLVAGFMIAAGFISLWISNTATAAMMLPLGISVVKLFANNGKQSLEPRDFRHFAASLMLGIAYASTIGGLGTLVGTPPNAFFAALMDERGKPVGFAEWMLFAMPLVIVYLAAAWALLTWVVFPVRLRELPGGRGLIRREFAKLGRMSRGEWTVLAVFLGAAAAWIVREPLANWNWLAAKLPAIGEIDDPWIAIAAALALFALPVDARRGVFALDWQTAKKVPWEVLLLFGGGLSLSAAMTKSGLADWIGGRVSLLADWPAWVAIVAVVILVLAVTEFASNLATVSALLPILASVAAGMGIDELWLLVPATVAATCGFAMPVGTPPNALVFGTGYVSIGQMLRAGLLLDLLGIVLIPVAIYLLGPLALGMK